VKIAKIVKIMKTAKEVNDRINEGKAVVYTAEEFKRMLRVGEDITPRDVDVVTTGTCGVMSGTAAVLSIPVAGRGAFARAKSVLLNGVPASPGPCPNENLGIVEAVLYGSTPSISGPMEYGGGHLFRELVEGREIDVEVDSGGKIFENRVTIEDLEFARIITTRTSVKNYTGFLNKGRDAVRTIFSVANGLKGPCKELSVSGCGELNPLENDPLGESIGVGTGILVNGAPGYVIGTGTRSSPEKPNLSVFADMRGMNPEYMGGFRTSDGVDCITSIAVPIIVTEDTLPNLKILDEDVKLPIADIHDRIPFAEGSYADLWQGTDMEVYFDPARCIGCDDCEVERYCPTNAFLRSGGIDRARCFNCGACLNLCPERAFKGNLGSIDVEGNEVPITLRQSNRARADELSRKLKEIILDGRFTLTDPVGSLR